MVQESLPHLFCAAEGAAEVEYTVAPVACYPSGYGVVHSMVGLSWLDMSVEHPTVEMPVLRTG